MYGLMIAAGYLVALLYIFRRNKDIGIERKNLEDLMFYILLSGILGGKLFYIFTYWSEFGAALSDKIIYIFRSFQYGFVFYGGFLTSLAVFFFFTWKKKMPRTATLDLIAPALALAHAFGRVGCFFAGCCYGRPTDSFFGVIFDNPQGEIPTALRGVPIHPVQLYEAFGNLILFTVLNQILSKEIRTKKLRGRVFCAYALLYGLLRFTLEFFRGDDRGSGLLSLSPAQTISAIIVIAAIVFLSVINKKNEKK